MRETLKKNLDKVFWTVGGGIATHFITKQLDAKEMAEFQNKIKNVENIENNILDLLKDSKLDISPEGYNFLKPKIEIIARSGKKVFDFINKEELSEKFKVSVNDNLSELTKAVEEINKYLESKNNNKFLPDFNLKDFNLNTLYEYLDSLTLLQESALLHIIIFLLILSTVYSILAALFGNEIIKYFNLENKYPKLNTFFSYRAKFQKYYLMWNISILFFLCIFGILLNIFSFVC